MNIYYEKVAALLRKDEVHIDKLRRWIACPITNRKKTIKIITIYRIPQETE